MRGHHPGTRRPLTLVLNGTDAEMGEMAATHFPVFEKQFPNVKIQYDNPPDYSTKLFVLAAAGSLGDVSTAYTNQGKYHLLSQMTFSPITNYLSRAINTISNSSTT